MSRLPYAVLAVFLLAAAPPPSSLPAGARAVLTHYLDALRAGRYDRAYGLLAAPERAYFRTPANFASVFLADRFALDGYTVQGAQTAGSAVLVDVGEHVHLFDHAHQRLVGVQLTALYGLTREGGAYRVREDVRAWKAFDPAGAQVSQQRLDATVRKISFYPGRVEVLLTFANFGDSFVTLLPYGRSTLRDQSGATYPLIETKIPALTDRELRLGLRLAGSAEYTGALTFAAPPHAAPTAFSLTVAPALRDGADEPFALQFATIPVPPT
ncbi:MAG TPA: hypothetical protein VME66_05230 [Candidatus Acidoferrales bacterium]|nr:hypothetical protein [Candidatus Acidoferrales bacterium]